MCRTLGSTKGKMIAQSATTSNRQPTGMKGSESAMIMSKLMKAITNATRNRLRIRGTSMKKFERSTSFFVAPHWML
jgi:hypothetical protein